MSALRKTRNQFRVCKGDEVTLVGADQAGGASAGAHDSWGKFGMRGYVRNGINTYPEDTPFTPVEQSV